MSMKQPSLRGQTAQTGLLHTHARFPPYRLPKSLTRNSRIDRPLRIGRRMTHLFLALRRKPRGSVSMAQTPEPVLLLRLIFAAPSAPRLRRRPGDVPDCPVTP